MNDARLYGKASVVEAAHGVAAGLVPAIYASYASCASGLCHLQGVTLYDGFSASAFANRW